MYVVCPCRLTGKSNKVPSVGTPSIGAAKLAIWSDPDPAFCANAEAPSKVQIMLNRRVRYNLRVIHDF